MTTYTLYDYWRSSAAYRVRIALNLKDISYASVSVNLKTGEQHGAQYRTVNPQGAVPMLVANGVNIPQSLAIMEYLEETHPTPPLLPENPVARARVRGMAQLVISDIHPINNQRVLKHIAATFGADDAAKEAWIGHWITKGFTALEEEVKRAGSNGKYCYGDSPTLADCCLIPQMYNARRFHCPLDAFPTLLAIDAHCNQLSAFEKAKPENQPDAEK